jgi:hypothetical protein
MNPKNFKRKQLQTVLLLACIIVITPACKKTENIWLVDEKIADQWETLLEKIPGAPVKTVGVYREGELPENRFGYIITKRLIKDAGTEDNGNTIVTVYQNLSRTLEYEGAMVLALDPWLIFNEYTDPAFERSRLAGGVNAAGLIIAPGGEPAARLAWLGQLLQKQSAIWPAGLERWTEEGNELFKSSLFQHGAFTYNWNNSWELFFKTKPAWIYAPYSRVRGLRASQTAGLTASRFPEPASWDNYGIQAELLWAVPFGTVKDRDVKLQDTKAWLQKGETQTVLADTLHWIPAVSSGRSYDSLAQSAKLIWSRSSYIWTIQ